jgi:hypothetical protein
MTRPKKIPVLHFSYETPNLRRGDPVDCLVRDCEIVITGWTDGPIPWPCGCPRRRSPGSPGILVEEELARAVRHESAKAVAYWWGVSGPTVCKWRRALGVDRQNNEGTQLLVHAAIDRATKANRRIGITDSYRQKQRENALRHRFWELAPKVTRGIPWTPEQLALLGTMYDREVAERTGHPKKSVQRTRQKLRIPAFCHSRDAR